MDTLSHTDTSMSAGESLMNYSLFNTHTQTAPAHNISLSAKDCFALDSALPLHQCDKGQSPKHNGRQQLAA